MGDGEGGWVRERFFGKKLGGEEMRDCDWVRKGIVVGKVLMRRVVWVCVEGYLGWKRGLR